MRRCIDSVVGLARGAAWTEALRTTKGTRSAAGWRIGRSGRKRPSRRRSIGRARGPRYLDDGERRSTPSELVSRRVDCDDLVVEGSFRPSNGAGSRRSGRLVEERGRTCLADLQAPLLREDPVRVVTVDL